MSGNKIEPFHLIITDKDQGIFNIIGPITDDTEWNTRVSQCQNSGRNVNCQTENKALTEELLINKTTRRLGLNYTTYPII